MPAPRLSRDAAAGRSSSAGRNLEASATSWRPEQEVGHVRPLGDEAALASRAATANKPRSHDQGRPAFPEVSGPGPPVRRAGGVRPGCSVDRRAGVDPVRPGGRGADRRRHHPPGHGSLCALRRHAVDRRHRSRVGAPTASPQRSPRSAPGCRASLPRPHSPCAGRAAAIPTDKGRRHDRSLGCDQLSDAHPLDGGTRKNHHPGRRALRLRAVQVLWHLSDRSEQHPHRGAGSPVPAALDGSGSGGRRRRRGPSAPAVRRSRLPGPLLRAGRDRTSHRHQPGELDAGVRDRNR